MTPAPTPEYILCSRTDSLPQPWLPEAGAVALSEERFLAVLDGLEPEWRPRPEAEQDPRYKQWIPYLLLLDPDGRIAAYPRRGSEERLHGLWSVGIGGHINPADAPTPSPAHAKPEGWWRDTLHRGLARELTEEFPAARPTATAQFLGLVHESQSAVGTVHLGAVYLAHLDHPASDAGHELRGLRWIEYRRLGSAEWPLDRFELWSRLAIQLLAGVRDA